MFVSMKNFEPMSLAWLVVDVRSDVLVFVLAGRAACTAAGDCSTG